MNEKFLIQIASFPDKEKVVAEVWHNNILFAVISQETSECVIEFFPHPSGQPWSFNLKESLQQIEKARNHLVGGEK